MMNEILENELVETLTGLFQPSPHKVNKLQQSDAEILDVRTGSDLRLAITTDSLVEEIALGLYDDPYLAGWMTVMANMSDLAAVGASPIGIMISQVLPKDLPTNVRNRLQQGIHEACEKCQTFVLGGDTNFGDEMALTGCAIGTVSKPMSRTGCQPGDLLYATDHLGGGNAFALSRLSNLTQTQIRYQPVARLQEGRFLRNHASSCMDTSDGALATLDQLMRLNNAGFELNDDWHSTLDPEVLTLAAEANIPPWLFMAGQHGEFELLFTVPRRAEEALLATAIPGGWQPLKLGKVVQHRGVIVPLSGERTQLDTAKIRNLANSFKGDAGRYMHELLKIDQQIQTHGASHVDSSYA